MKTDLFYIKVFVVMCISAMLVVMGMAEDGSGHTMIAAIGVFGFVCSVGIGSDAVRSDNEYQAKHGNDKRTDNKG